MEAAISAVSWVLGKALAPVTDGLLEAWAASAGLGPNMDALKMELLYAQAMLDNTQGREVRSPALKELLLKLRQQAYKADDVLDELEYFRIQDELDGTYKAAGEHPGGCIHSHALHARSSAGALATKLCFSSGASRRDDRDEQDDDATKVSCGAWPCRGPRTRDDEEAEQEEEKDASRGARCGVVWPCVGRASSEAHKKSPPTTNPNLHGDDIGGGCITCMGRLASSARDTICTVGKHLTCSSDSPMQNDPNSDMASNRRRFLCCARPNKAPQGERVIETKKLKFNRVEISERMKEIVEQLRPVCKKVSIVLNLELLDSNRCIAQNIDRRLASKEQGRKPSVSDSAAGSRPITTSGFIESEFYGRTHETSKIIHDITKGQYRDNDITVLPIVGPGGIGKTTLTKYMYKELEEIFPVKAWVCVSTNFNVYRLIQEVADNLKKDSNDSPEKRIQDRIQSNKFLLVLDDMWNCSDVGEWKRFLTLFTKGQMKGNIILVTTRFPGVAQLVKTTDQIVNLEGLDEEAYKKLFLACIFGDQQQLAYDHAELHDTGSKIMHQLKRNPLAAKTVGKLLSKQLDLDHWTRVLESKEWELQNGDDDIMPALKLSYDYLPFHLQQCFTYCALFPEDYKFGEEELIQLWIGLGVLHSHGGNIRITDVGLPYLFELVNYGFLKKDGTKYGSDCYVIHDLLHELALKVSSHECLSICSTQVTSTHIPPLIHHLSINIEDTSVMDRANFDNCLKHFEIVKKRLIVENLHTLMIFGDYHGNFVKIFGRLFKEAKSLRVIFLSTSKVSYSLEDLFPHFLELVHLRYFRNNENPLTTALYTHISRFYHLRVLDLQKIQKTFVLPRDMSNLVRLHHLLLRDRSMYYEIAEVGKLQSLQELKYFSVKNKAEGFELRQIGHLVELGGSLCIDNLQKVKAKEDAVEAKLKYKRHLRKLKLIWGNDGSDDRDSAHEEQVLEGLKPDSNLLELCIKGHRGTTCPSWLGVNLSVENLESLRLDDVAWKIFPPIAELWLVNDNGEELAVSITGQAFKNLRKLELAKLPRLKRWVQNAPCHLFPHLEELSIGYCSELVELSFSHSTCCEQKKEGRISWFSSLQNLRITDCPNLSSFPCVPWSSTKCSAYINRIGSGLETLRLIPKNLDSQYGLQIEVKEARGSEFWDVLSFHNLGELQVLKIDGCPPLPLDYLQMLSSLKTLRIRNSSNAFQPVQGKRCGGYRFPIIEKFLKTLRISNSSNAFQPVQGKSCGGYRFPIEQFEIEKITGLSGRDLTELRTCFPNLSTFYIDDCEKITGLSVARTVEEEIPEGMLLLPPQLRTLQISNFPQLIRLETGGQLQALRISLCPQLIRLETGGQLQALQIVHCPQLILASSPIDDLGVWLQGLTSLRSLAISGCPHFLSSYSSGFLFPASLQKLSLLGFETMVPLSNLTSLTELYVENCGEFRGEGLWPLLAQGHLIRDLTVFGSRNFFAGIHSLPQGCSPKLPQIRTDGGVLAADVCKLLASSLTTLSLEFAEVVRFTKQQQDALLLLSSIQHLRFSYCHKLQFLPAGLHRLPNLKKLDIFSCESIVSLPKDIHRSPMQELQIEFCPAIRSLPKEGLPSSLRVLDVSLGNSDELRMRCRKLSGTIPVVKT